MAAVHLALEAMATRFELVLPGSNASALRAAGEEALQEILRIEAAISLYRPDSQVAAINRSAGDAAVRTTPEVFGLIRHAVLLSQATSGAFDITVGPLLQAWGLMRGTGAMPEPEALAAARQRVGFQSILLEEDGCRVGLRQAGAMLDLGSIGKGYALDRAAEILREVGVEKAFLHGGTSTALGIGRDEEDRPWRIAIDRPADAGDFVVEGGRKADGPLAVVDLEDTSLSVSAVWGKGFVAGDRYFGHVMDPRLGAPVDGALLAAVVLPSATESDALSTALLVEGAELLQRWSGWAQAPRGLVVERGNETGTGLRVSTCGLTVNHSA